MTIVKGQLATSVKKKVKTKFVYLDDTGNNKLPHRLLLSLACWLMLARRLCVYNVGLKVKVTQEISTVVMTSYYENFHLCKTQSSSAIHFAFS